MDWAWFLDIWLFFLSQHTKYVAWPNINCESSRNYVLYFCLIRNVAYFSADTCIFNFSRYSCNSRLCLSAVSLFLARRTRLSAKARTEMFSFPILIPFVVSSNVLIMGARIKLKSNRDSGSPFNSSQYVIGRVLSLAMYYGFATFVLVLDVFAYEIWNSFDLQSFANCPVRNCVKSFRDVNYCYNST